MTTLPLDVLFRDHGGVAGLNNIAKAATSAASATAKLDAANAKLAASERKVADAAGQVKLAEAKLEQVRSNAKATMTQRLAAEENLARSHRRLQGAQSDLAMSSRRVSLAQKEVATAQHAAAAAADNSRSAFQRAAGGLRTMGSVGVSASHKMVGGLKMVGVGAAGVAVGILALAAAPIKFGLEVAAANEQAQISFTTMLGSAKKASDFLTKLKTFAAKTPFEFPELQTAASSLISVGISASKVIPIMTTLGNVTSGMGTGSEGVKRATIALQQMSAAGRISAEDLNQLRDAGIPTNLLFDAMAKRLHTTSGKLMEMRDSGKLGKKELQALMEVLQSGKGFERFNGLMDKQSKSLTGMLSTLKDTLGQGLAESLQYAIPFLKGAIKSVTTAMGRWFAFTQSHQEAMVNGLIAVGNAVLSIG